LTAGQPAQRIPTAIEGRQSRRRVGRLLGLFLTCAKEHCYESLDWEGVQISDVEIAVICDCRGNNVSLSSRGVCNPPDLAIRGNHVQLAVIRFDRKESTSDCNHAVPCAVRLEVRGIWVLDRVCLQEGRQIAVRDFSRGRLLAWTCRYGQCRASRECRWHHDDDCRDSIIKDSECPDHSCSMALSGLFRHRRAAFFIPNAVMQNYPDQVTEAMRNHADGFVARWRYSCPAE